ncbi:hypothetical protein BCR36DRAFT_587008 [Piromyces finnis]|uniref:HSF-type DNA-binding domain-containing protein n=1 Tax=Piromyces finnis TaxID=1754191 RepID=A0A1Y1UXA4_9FUNG|nr:hypothetical protein BCR36DRAFT_587008 [Piromyces finnis]|eukprot:ORX42738.1 hypothetical protein BCR36DRAFT_587008 [Piromyces finnis]
MSSVYQLPSPPTQQPINQLPYNGMAKSGSNQISTPKEGMVNKLPGVSTVTTNGQPVQVNSNAAVSGTNLKTVTKKKSDYLGSHPLKIDTSVVSQGTPVSPTSQSSSPQPTSASSTTNSTQSPRPKSNNNNTFVHKLYQMLSDPKQSKFIKWNDSGFSFTIRNVQGFSRNVLPLHFRHNNFSSFVRQLNMYGFHKVNKSAPKGSENQIWEFFHPKFVRGKPHLIEEIKRKQLENENYRANLLLEQTRVLVRQNSYGNLSNKRSSTNLVNCTTNQLVPSNSNAMVNPQITNPEMQAQHPVFIHATEGIPANNINVSTSGEPVLIDPASLHNTPTLPMVQQVTVPSTNYNVIQVPSQTIPYNEVTAAPAVTGTPIPQAMTMGSVMPQNPQAMVDPANVVVGSHTILPPEVPSVTSQPPPPPMENDVYYNIQLLQMQNQDMNQRLNDLQANVNNLMNSYTRRMDMQQNLIQQLLSTAQQQSQPTMSNVTTVCSVDQGPAMTSSYDVNNPMMAQGATIVGNNPQIQHQQMIQQSPVLVQSNSQDQKIMSQNQGAPVIKQEPIDQYQMNNQLSNGVAYPTQTIYY